ncbi:MAG: hypothetical protein E6J20_00240 [Chloroflexi bacterium]|nr:MAG: hypothetical protein E6J20_00240 [Chloroflexota bacterium]
MVRLLVRWVRRRRYRRGYLRSVHWKQYRCAWWRAHPLARCAVCGCGHPLDLHHITYARLGEERFTDVVPLCRADHDAVHGRGGGRQALRA